MNLERPTRECLRCGPHHPPLFGLSPGGVYLAGKVTFPAGALLPHLFTLTRMFDHAGGIFSVALALFLRTVGVTHHPALWSADFPLPKKGNGCLGILKATFI